MRLPAALTLLLAVVCAAAGCGGAASSGTGASLTPDPDPDCQATVRDALMRLIGVEEQKVHIRVVSSSMQSSKCAYRAGRERVTVEVDSGPQAYQAFDTVNVHQVQANVGRTKAAKPDEYPKEVHGVGVLADWIPSEHQLIATNATRQGGGAFVRVTVVHAAKGAPPERKVAKGVARASLRTAPRGP